MAINVNGKHFNVSYDEEGNIICKKIEIDGSESEASNEEIKEIINTLQNKINSKDNVGNAQELSIEEIIDQIKDMIDGGQIKNYDDLYNHINELNKTEEEKHEIYEQTKNYLANKQKDPKIQKYKNIIFEYLRKNRSKDASMYVKFTHKSIIGGKDTCQIELIGEMGGVSKSLAGELNDELDYTDELKKELIEPVLQEVVLQSELTVNECNQEARLDETKYNMKFGTENNNFVILNEIEPDYKNFIQKEIYRIGNVNKITSASGRDDYIKANQQQRNLNEQQEFDNIQTQENLSESNTQALAQEQKMVLKRSLDKTGSSVFTLLISIITIVVTFITISLVL